MAKYKNSLEINDRKAQLQKRCKDIIKQCREEVREMNEEEKEEVENAKSEIEQLKEELKALQQRLNEFDEIEKEIEDEEVEEPTEDKEEEIKSNIRKKMNKQKFSLLKAINDVVNNRNFDRATEAVINEGANEMRKAGIAFSGQIQLPLEKRTISVATEHDNVIGLDTMDWEQPLRAKNVLVNAGAKFLSNLQSDVLIPIMSGSNVNWADEVGTAEDGGASFSSVKLSPKRLTAYLKISKTFLTQSSESAENMLKNDLINAINSKLEATILGDAEGTNERPQGIFYGKTIDNATTTFAQLTALESGVEDANVINPTSYVMSNSAKGAFRAMAKSSKNTQLVMEAGEIDGVKCYNTSNVKANHFIYGDFSNLVIGSFGSLDITIDPYTAAKENSIVLVVNYFVDSQILRPEAFAVGKTV